MVTGGPVDAVTGDYLAEVTMLVLARSRLRNPDAGYAASFLRQLEPVIAEVADRGIKVVTNAGGLNPSGMADQLAGILARLGIGLRVARVGGDDLMPRMQELLAAGTSLDNLDSGAPISSWGHDPLTANAYLGGFGITEALRSGADIVVTGRVADASLAVGVAAWWWDWECNDHDALAGAVVAGHVIECGAQATGGNYSGFKRISGLAHPGFPIAEIEDDGSSVITKHPGTGGAVTVGTVTAQLLYEVGPPTYLNPDVVAHLDSIELASQSEDRVRLTRIRGSAPPSTTKVAITGLGGWRNQMTVVITGLDVDAKAELVSKALRPLLADTEGIYDVRFTRIGTAAVDPDDQMAGSCLLHVAVDGTESGCGRAFSSKVVELALANFPGIYMTDPPGSGAPYGAYWPGTIEQSALEHVVVKEDGSRKVIPPPTGFGDSSLADDSPLGSDSRTANGVDPHREQGAVHEADDCESAALAVESDDPSSSVSVPLGLVADARSGDKGGDANVGVWVEDPRAWTWLRDELTTDELKRLLPETSHLPIDRYELPNLRAVNFVVHGLLDGGATEARRFDKQAKALGEWLRARHVAMPKWLLDAAGGGQG